MKLEGLFERQHRRDQRETGEGRIESIPPAIEKDKRDQGELAGDNDVASPFIEGNELECLGYADGDEENVESHQRNEQPNRPGISLKISQDSLSGRNDLESSHVSTLPVTPSLDRTIGYETKLR